MDTLSLAKNLNYDIDVLVIKGRELYILKVYKRPFNTWGRRYRAKTYCRLKV